MHKEMTMRESHNANDDRNVCILIDQEIWILCQIEHNCILFTPT